jgi:hypothetical protein
MPRRPSAKAAEWDRTSTAEPTQSPSAPRDPNIARLGQQVRIGERQRDAARPEPFRWATWVTSNDPILVKIAVGRLRLIGEQSKTMPMVAGKS